MKNVITLLFIVASVSAIAQQKVAARNDYDPLFPARGKFSAGLMTTYGGINPPPILVGDVTYGVTRRFAMGLVGGTTGAQGLYGLKLNGKVQEHGPFSVNVRAMTIYYPGRDGKFLFDKSSRHIIPWMASLANLEGEWRTPKNIRWAAGVGGLETHCMVRLKKWLHGESEDAIVPIDLFATANVSASFPISARLTIKPEVLVVFNQKGLIKRAQNMVSSPVNPFVNLVYNFK